MSLFFYKDDLTPERAQYLSDGQHPSTINGVIRALKGRHIDRMLIVSGWYVSLSGLNYEEWYLMGVAHR